jgi:hypothetical protein
MCEWGFTLHRKLGVSVMLMAIIGGVAAAAVMLGSVTGTCMLVEYDKAQEEAYEAANIKARKEDSEPVARVGWKKGLCRAGIVAGGIVTFCAFIGMIACLPAEPIVVAMAPAMM